LSKSKNVVPQPVYDRLVEPSPEGALRSLNKPPPPFTCMLLPSLARWVMKR